MRIGNVILDTDNMKLEEVDTLISELRKVHARKKESNDALVSLLSLLTHMHDHNLDFTHKNTGEVLCFEDWGVFDHDLQTFQSEVV